MHLLCKELKSMEGSLVMRGVRVITPLCYWGLKPFLQLSIGAFHNIQYKEGVAGNKLGQEGEAVISRPEHLIRTEEWPRILHPGGRKMPHSVWQKLQQHPSHLLPLSVAPVIINKCCDDVLWGQEVQVTVPCCQSHPSNLGHKGSQLAEVLHGGQVVVNSSGAHAALQKSGPIE